MLFALTVTACIISAIVTITFFVLYIRARLADRSEQTPFDPDEHTRRLAALDRKERFYQSVHFFALFLFVLFGVLILIHLSNHLNNRMQT